MKNEQRKTGRYVNRTSHILNKRGYVRTKANYWTINAEGNRSSRHSIQSGTSKRTLVNNDTFNTLYAQAIKQGAVLHNLQYRRHTNDSVTYSIISYEIIYDTVHPLDISYNHKKNIVTVKEPRHKTITYKEEKSLRKARETFFDKDAEFRKKETIKKAQYKDAQITRKEYLSIIGQFSRLRNKKSK